MVQLVPSDQTSWAGGTHLDLRVDAVAVPVRRTEELGGVTVRPPAFYPSEEQPYLQLAMMADPFGSEFCVGRWRLVPQAAGED